MNKDFRAKMDPGAESEETGHQEPQDANLDRPAPAGEFGDMLPIEENVWKHSLNLVILNFLFLDVVYYQAPDKERTGESDQRKLIM